ncbi:MAG: hypothetical protein PHQ43_02690, partial [Dehalococcoidales bacterium]|nr:hypothetical protein [Dehalococcoidales bacterium]
PPQLLADAGALDTHKTLTDQERQQRAAFEETKKTDTAYQGLDATKKDRAFMEWQSQQDSDLGRVTKDVLAKKADAKIADVSAAFQDFKKTQANYHAVELLPEGKAANQWLISSLQTPFTAGLSQDQVNLHLVNHAGDKAFYANVADRYKPYIKTATMSADNNSNIYFDRSGQLEFFTLTNYLKEATPGEGQFIALSHRGEDGKLLDAGGYYASELALAYGLKEGRTLLEVIGGGKSKIYSGNNAYTYTTDGKELKKASFEGWQLEAGSAPGRGNIGIWGISSVDPAFSWEGAKAVSILSSPFSGQLQGYSLGAEQLEQLKGLAETIGFEGDIKDREALRKSLIEFNQRRAKELKLDMKINESDSFAAAIEAFDKINVAEFRDIATNNGLVRRKLRELYPDYDFEKDRTDGFTKLREALGLTQGTLWEMNFKLSKDERVKKYLPADYDLTRDKNFVVLKEAVLKAEQDALANARELARDPKVLEHLPRGYDPDKDQGFRVLRAALNKVNMEWEGIDRQKVKITVYGGKSTTLTLVEGSVDLYDDGHGNIFRRQSDGRFIQSAGKIVGIRAVKAYTGDSEVDIQADRDYDLLIEDGKIKLIYGGPVFKDNQGNLYKLTADGGFIRISDNKYIYSSRAIPDSFKHAEGELSFEQMSNAELLKARDNLAAQLKQPAFSAPGSGPRSERVKITRIDAILRQRGREPEIKLRGAVESFERFAGFVNGLNATAKDMRWREEEAARPEGRKFLVENSYYGELRVKLREDRLQIKGEVQQVRNYIDHQLRPLLRDRSLPAIDRERIQNFIDKITPVLDEVEGQAPGRWERWFVNNWNIANEAVSKFYHDQGISYSYYNPNALSGTIFIVTLGVGAYVGVAGQATAVTAEAVGGAATASTAVAQSAQAVSMLSRVGTFAGHTLNFMRWTEIGLGSYDLFNRFSGIDPDSQYSIALLETAAGVPLKGIGHVTGLVGWDAPYNFGQYLMDDASGYMNDQMIKNRYMQHYSSTRSFVNAVAQTSYGMASFFPNLFNNPLETAKSVPDLIPHWVDQTETNPSAALGEAAGFLLPSAGVGIGRYRAALKGAAAKGGAPAVAPLAPRLAAIEGLKASGKSLQGLGEFLGTTFLVGQIAKVVSGLDSNDLQQPGVGNWQIGLPVLPTLIPGLVRIFPRQKAVSRERVVRQSDLLVDEFGNALTERGQRLQQAQRDSAARTAKILGPDGKPVDGSADSRSQSGIVDANGDSVAEVAFSSLAKPRSSGLILPREAAPAEQPAAIISARGAASEVTPQEVMTRAEQLRQKGQRPTVIARTNEGEWIVADPAKSNYGERMGKIGQAQEGGRLASIRESYVDPQAAAHFRGQPEAGFTEAPREGQPRRVVIVHDPNSRNALTHAAAEDFVSLAEANARGRSHPDNADTALAHETAQDLAPVEISKPVARPKQPAGTLPIIEESPAPLSYSFLRPANQPFQEAQVAEIAARSRSSAPKIRPDKVRDEVRRASDVLGVDPVETTRQQLEQIRRSPRLTPEEKIVAETIVASRNQVIAESGGYKSSFLEWQADSTARIEQGRQQNPDSAVEAIAMPGSTKTVVNAIQAMLRGAEGRSVHMLEPNAENVRAKSQSESPLTALWTEKLGRPVIRIYATGNGQAVERFNPATGRFEALKGSPKQARAAVEALLRQNPLIYIDEASLLSFDLEGSPIVGQGKNGTTLIHDDPNYTRMHEGMRRGGRPMLYETRDYLLSVLRGETPKGMVLELRPYGSDPGNGSVPRELTPQQRAQAEASLAQVEAAITEAESQVRLFDRIGRIARDRYMRDPLHAVRFEGGEIRLVAGRDIVTQVAREYGLQLSEAQTSQLVEFCDRVGWVLETQRHSRTDYVSTGPDGTKVRLAHDGVRWEGIDGERMTGAARKILRLMSVSESAGMRDKVEAWLTADAPETNVVRIYYKYGLSDVMMSTGTPMTAATADGYVHQVNLTARASLPEGMYHRIVARGNSEAVAERITQDFIGSQPDAPVKLVLVTGNTGEPIEATLKAVASRNRVSVIRVSEASLSSGRFDTAEFLKSFEGRDTVVIYASGENPMVRSRIIDIVTAARKARIREGGRRPLNVVFGTPDFKFGSNIAEDVAGASGKKSPSISICLGPDDTARQEQWWNRIFGKNRGPGRGVYEIIDTDMAARDLDRGETSAILRTGLRRRSNTQSLMGQDGKPLTDASGKPIVEVKPGSRAWQEIERIEGDRLEASQTSVRTLLEGKGDSSTLRHRRVASSTATDEMPTVEATVSAAESRLADFKGKGLTVDGGPVETLPQQQATAEVADAGRNKAAPEIPFVEPALVAGARAVHDTAREQANALGETVSDTAGRLKRQEIAAERAIDAAAQAEAAAATASPEQRPALEESVRQARVIETTALAELQQLEIQLAQQQQEHAIAVANSSAAQREFVAEVDANMPAPTSTLGIAGQEYAAAVESGNPVRIFAAEVQLDREIERANKHVAADADIEVLSSTISSSGQAVNKGPAPVTEGPATSLTTLNREIRQARSELTANQAQVERTQSQLDRAEDQLARLENDENTPPPAQLKSQFEEVDTRRRELAAQEAAVAGSQAELDNLRQTRDYLKRGLIQDRDGRFALTDYGTRMFGVASAEDRGQIDAVLTRANQRVAQIRVDPSAWFALDQVIAQQEAILEVEEVAALGDAHDQAVIDQAEENLRDLRQTRENLEGGYLALDGRGLVVIPPAHYFTDEEKPEEEAIVARVNNLLLENLPQNILSEDALPAAEVPEFIHPQGDDRLSYLGRQVSQIASRQETQARDLLKQEIADTQARITRLEATLAQREQQQARAEDDLANAEDFNPGQLDASYAANRQAEAAVGQARESLAAEKQRLQSLNNLAELQEQGVGVYTPVTQPDLIAFGEDELTTEFMGWFNDPVNGLVAANPFTGTRDLTQRGLEAVQLFGENQRRKPNELVTIARSLGLTEDEAKIQAYRPTRMVPQETVLHVSQAMTEGDFSRVFALAQQPDQPVESTLESFGLDNLTTLPPLTRAIHTAKQFTDAGLSAQDYTLALALGAILKNAGVEASLDELGQLSRQMQGSPLAREQFLLDKLGWPLVQLGQARMDEDGYLEFTDYGRNRLQALSLQQQDDERAKFEGKDLLLAQELSRIVEPRLTAEKEFEQAQEAFRADPHSKKVAQRLEAAVRGRQESAVSLGVIAKDDGLAGLLDMNPAEVQLGLFGEGFNYQDIVSARNALPFLEEHAPLADVYDLTAPELKNITHSPLDVFGWLSEHAVGTDEAQTQALRNAFSVNYNRLRDKENVSLVWLNMLAGELQQASDAHARMNPVQRAAAPAVLAQAADALPKLNGLIEELNKQGVQEVPFGRLRAAVEDDELLRGVTIGESKPLTITTLDPLVTDLASVRKMEVPLSALRPDAGSIIPVQLNGRRFDVERTGSPRTFRVSEIVPQYTPILGDNGLITDNPGIMRRLVNFFSRPPQEFLRTGSTQYVALPQFNPGVQSSGASNLTLVPEHAVDKARRSIYTLVSQGRFNGEVIDQLIRIPTYRPVEMLSMGPDRNPVMQEMPLSTIAGRIQEGGLPKVFEAERNDKQLFALLSGQGNGVPGISSIGTALPNAEHNRVISEAFLRNEHSVLGYTQDGIRAVHVPDLQYGHVGFGLDGNTPSIYIGNAPQVPHELAEARLHVQEKLDLGFSTGQYYSQLTAVRAQQIHEQANAAVLQAAPIAQHQADIIGRALAAFTGMPTEDQSGHRPPEQEAPLSKNPLPLPIVPVRVNGFNNTAVPMAAVAPSLSIATPVGVTNIGAAPSIFTLPDIHGQNMSTFGTQILGQAGGVSQAAALSASAGSRSGDRAQIYPQSNKGFIPSTEPSSEKSFGTRGSTRAYSLPQEISVGFLNGSGASRSLSNLNATHPGFTSVFVVLNDATPSSLPIINNPVTNFHYLRPITQLFAGIRAVFSGDLVSARGFFRVSNETRRFVGLFGVVANNRLSPAELTEVARQYSPFVRKAIMMHESGRNEAEGLANQRQYFASATQNSRLFLPRHIELSVLHLGRLKQEALIWGTYGLSVPQRLAIEAEYNKIINRLLDMPSDRQIEQQIVPALVECLAVASETMPYSYFSFFYGFNAIFELFSGDVSTIPAVSPSMQRTIRRTMSNRLKTITGDARLPFIRAMFYVYGTNYHYEAKFFAELFEENRPGDRERILTIVGASSPAVYYRETFQRLLMIQAVRDTLTEIADGKFDWFNQLHAQAGYISLVAAGNNHQYNGAYNQHLYNLREQHNGLQRDAFTAYLQMTAQSLTAHPIRAARQLVAAVAALLRRDLVSARGFFRVSNETRKIAGLFGKVADSTGYRHPRFNELPQDVQESVNIHEAQPNERAALEAQRVAFRQNITGPHALNPVAGQSAANINEGVQQPSSRERGNVTPVGALVNTTGDNRLQPGPQSGLVPVAAGNAADLARSASTLLQGIDPSSAPYQELVSRLQVLNRRRMLAAGLAAALTVAGVSVAEGRIVVEAEHLPAEMRDAIEKSFKITKAFLTMPAQDPTVRKYTADAQRLLNSDEVVIHLVVADLLASERVQESLATQYQNKGTAMARVEFISENEYRIIYDYRILEMGLGMMIMGIAHEVIGHMTIPQEERRRLSVFEDEEIAFSRSIDYVQGLVDDRGVWEQVGGRDHPVLQDLRAILVQQREVLEFVRAEVAKERQARNRNIALGVSLPVITAAAAYGGYRL